MFGLIHKHQKLKATKMFFIYEWTDKPTHPNNGQFFGAETK